MPSRVAVMSIGREQQRIAVDVTELERERLVQNLMSRVAVFVGDDAHGNDDAFGRGRAVVVRVAGLILERHEARGGLHVERAAHAVSDELRPKTIAVQ